MKYMAAAVAFSSGPTAADMLDDLYDTGPNFSEVIDELKKYLALLWASNEPMSFTLILLFGEPGWQDPISPVNWRVVARHRARIRFMRTPTAGWILSGASSQWNNAKPGKVAHALVHGEFANPVVVPDESGQGWRRYALRPDGRLYGLLEKETASHFKDEFIEIDMDASHILWVSTANDEAGHP